MSATRIALDWQPSKEMIDYAIDLGFPIDRVKRITEDFRDHWLAASGRTAKKDNWEAAWRLWCRRDKDDYFGRGRRPQRQSIMDIAMDLEERARG